jgi:peptide-methionine (S)-S-oxide reductase
MGGHIKDPSYALVSTGRSGHTEVLQVSFDPRKVGYEKLLETFWLNHDPTTLDQQFCDHGSQYRPSIFFHDAEQKRLAEASKAKWRKEKPFKDDIVTPIVPASDFWPAEEYHQDYYKKNPARYRFYVTGCGRYARLDELWGKYRAK